MLLSTYPIRLPAFEGPLDLLLQLIERDELDITAISLAQVTDQYLAIIEEMGRRNLADLTAFLVVAAKLVLIKSRVLLPRPPSAEDLDAEDVAADLIRQLEMYRRFKEVAKELGEREKAGLSAYVRLATTGPAPAWFDLEGVTLEGLLSAAQEALEALPAPPADEVIPPPPVTVADQIALIEERLAHRRRIRFQEILSEAASRVEVIITLLAVLELVKQDRVRVWQEGLFGPIFIEVPEDEPAPATAPAPSPA